MKMVNLLEYLYRPFIETCFLLYHLLLLIYYFITDRKINDKNRKKLKRIVLGNKSFNQGKIFLSKNHLSINFPWVLKFIWNCLIFWGIYKIIIELGLIEIVKLFL